MAILLNAAPFTLFAVGHQTVPSVVAAIINAAAPLATLVVVLAAFSEERPTRQRVAGLLVGFAGILVILGAWRGLAAGQWTGVLACLGAIACYGIAFPRVTFLGEDLIWKQPVGALIVLSGVATTQLRRPRLQLPHRR